MKIFFLPLVLMALVYTGSASAAQAWIDGQIVRTMTTEDSVYGGCIARITGKASNRLACPDTWFTADCAGTLGGSRTEGKIRWDQLLLAYLTDESISVRMDDSKKINGLCFIDRIRLQREVAPAP